jgi:hypothetical protein
LAYYFGIGGCIFLSLFLVVVFKIGNISVDLPEPTVLVGEELEAAKKKWRAENKFD